MPSCVILYHYYYPDDVVSARHFTDLAEGLAEQGWNVKLYTSNRYCRKKGSITPLREIYNNVNIHRFVHPPFPQSTNIGRLLNGACLGVQWFFALLFVRTDIIIFGTDPQFLFFMIPLLAFFRPKLHIAIWGFDLYPEALTAEGIRLPAGFAKLLEWWAGVSYRHCDLLIDIGECMRSRFVAYHSSAICKTIVPWALYEPAVFIPSR